MQTKLTWIWSPYRQWNVNNKEWNIVEHSKEIFDYTVRIRIHHTWPGLSTVWKTSDIWSDFTRMRLRHSLSSSPPTVHMTSDVDAWLHSCCESIHAGMKTSILNRICHTFLSTKTRLPSARSIFHGPQTACVAKNVWYLSLKWVVSLFVLTNLIKE